MARDKVEMGAVSWSDALPFVRLFTTHRRASSFGPMVLALAGVLVCYCLGRAMDRAWLGAGAGALVAPSHSMPSEIDAFSALDSAGFARWKKQAVETVENLPPVDAAKQRQRVTDATTLVNERLAGALAERAASKEAAESQSDEMLAMFTAGGYERPSLDDLRRDADVLRLLLHGDDLRVLEPARLTSMLRVGRGRARFAHLPLDSAQRLFDADTTLSMSERRTQLEQVSQAIERQFDLDERRRSSPRGPFISLMTFEMRCAAGAIRAVCAGRWGLTGSAAGGALLDNVLAGLRGELWLVTQHPWFAAIFGLVLLLVGSLLGGAICRYAAVQSTREDNLPLTKALAFSRAKLPSLVAAPLLPSGIFVFVGLCMFAGGILAAIPVLGEFFTGLLFPIALLGGVALVFCLLAVVFGFHLMWPTIGVEGSDAFDAVQRSAGYLFQRPWHVGFYSFTLMLYATVWVLVARVIAILLLKLTHGAVGGGMSFLGTFSSARTDTLGKLDAMWAMPAWADLTLLPRIASQPFWGTFYNAPLGGAETIGAALLSVWVFLVVGAVVAYGVSFYLCGSTEMYLLLRRNVDGVDYDEIYYEEELDELYDEEQSQDDANDDSADTTSRGDQHDKDD